MHDLPTLHEVLAYKNPLVLQRFCENFPQEASRAEALFMDLLRYLWLCERHHWDTQNDPHNPAFHFIPVMHEEMRVIDAMWHEFILITRDYHDFCHHYFGHFLHHEPNMKDTLAYSEEQFIHSLHLFLNYVHEVLGEEVLKAWFAEHFSQPAY